MELEHGLCFGRSADSRLLPTTGYLLFISPFCVSLFPLMLTTQEMFHVICSDLHLWPDSAAFCDHKTPLISHRKDRRSDIGPCSHPLATYIHQITPSNRGTAFIFNSVTTHFILTFKFILTFIP